MARFRMPNVPRDQALLYSTRLDDAVPEGHPVRHVLSLLESEQVRPVISRLANTYSRGRGQPGYHPLYLVALYLYGMLIGERSSRRLEQACHNRIDVMWLLEGQHPDHSTIAGFQKRWSKELSELLKAVVLVARDAGLIKLDLVAVDGTKVVANASKHSVKKKDDLLREKEAVDAKIEKMEAEWEANEAEEAALGDDVPWTPPKGTPEEHRERQRSRMATPEGQSAYRRRSPLVEGRIAHLQSLGLRRFLRRGRSGALFEWLLGSIALNVKILSRHWEAVGGVIGEAHPAPARA